MKGQGVVGTHDIGNKAFLHSEVLGGAHVATDLAVDNNLRTHIGSRFKKDGIHQNGRLYSRCLRLNNLCPAHLKTFACDVRVQSHVLGLERSHIVSVLTEDAAERRTEHALSGVGHCSLDHDGSGFLHERTSLTAESRRSFSVVVRMAMRK